MIGLKQLASLLAGAIVLLGSVLVPAGQDGAVAIETTQDGATRALADEPATVSLGPIQAYDLITSRGAPTPPTRLDGGFETVRFLTAATDGTATATLGAKNVPVPAGSQVLVRGLSGTLDVREADVGVFLVLTGTAKSLEVQPPSAPALETYAGSQPSIPVTNVTLDGKAIDAGFEQGGSYDEIEFTVQEPSGPSEAAPTLSQGADTFPIEQTVRVRVDGFAGLVAVAKIDRDQISLQLDGFGNVTILDQQVRREVHQDVTVEIGEPNEPPEANFTFRPESPEAGETVHFRDTSSEDIAIRSWNWTFGDGASSDVEHPEHTYARDGTFEVTLTVTDVGGRQDSKTRLVEVVNSRPIVRLDWTPRPVIEGKPVTFFANASDRDGDVIDYDWDVPNATGLSGPVVNHTFAREGLHEVAVTVTDEEGAKAHANATIDVKNQAPKADFTVDPPNPQMRETVFFQSTSSDYGDGQIVDHAWDIESVGSVDGDVAKVTFPSDGLKEVRLTVRDDDGDTDTHRRTINVSNAPPLATIEIRPQPPNPDEPVTFEAEVVDDDPIEDATWTFSDGVTRQGLKVQRGFAEGGTYEVTLQLTDADGDTSTFSKTFEVNNAPSVSLGPINKESTDEIAVQTNELFTVTARFSDPEDNVTGISWSVDGQRPAQVSECVLAPDGNRSRLQCSWPDDGEHLILVHVRDEHGAVSAAKTKVLVLNRAPILNPDSLSGVVNVGETVHLDSNARDLDGTVEEVVWTVDGERVGLGIEISIRFEEPGLRTVRVNATDDDGAVESTTFTVDVNARPQVNVDFSPEEPTAGDPVTFTATATDPDGSDSALSYAWEFGDGTTGTGSQTSHTYDVGGTYLVNLTVTDEAGASTLKQIQLPVDTPPLEATLAISPTQPRVGQQVTFTLDIADGRQVEQIRWNFGDGTAETTGDGVKQNTHTYDEPGTYQVTLDIEADHGGSERLNTNVRVTADRPHELVFQPSLPNGQCLNLASPEVTFEAINLANTFSIGLDDDEDAKWILTGECTTRFTLPPGAWSPSDQLEIVFGVGRHDETRSFLLEGNRTVDRDLRLRQAPIFFEQLELVSPGQTSDSEDNATYRDPTRTVFVKGQAVWGEGTIARNISVGMQTTYRGPENFTGPGLQYNEDRAHIPQNGTLWAPVPAPAFETQTPATDGGGPRVAYLPGQYRVVTSVSSGMFSDSQTRSFVEDPAGLFEALDDA